MDCAGSLVVIDMSVTDSGKLLLMAGISTRIRKYAILFHRWMGVVFCLLFSMWFVSGIVMMYWDFPEVGAAERMEHALPLDAAKVRTTPQQAFTALQPADPPDQIRLAMYDGRPMWHFRIGRSDGSVWADTGELFEAVPPALALRVASAFSGQPAAQARFDGYNFKPDQWTVIESLEDQRPLLKYTWPDGEEVYVSEVTGEVAQRTTRASRIGAYFGAIPHWLFFSPLRRNGALWTKVVIWSSGIGAVASLLGLIVGFWLYSPVRKRYRFPAGRSSIPYSGQKHWHTVLGLIFGLVTCTWALSGMLSMEPFAWQNERPGAAVSRLLRPGRLRPEAFGERLPAEAMAIVPAGFNVRELELVSFGGEPAYIAKESPLRSVVIPLRGVATPAFSTERMVQLIRPAEARLVTEYEAYYLTRHHDRPLPVLFVRLNDAAGSMYYIDPRTARVVQSYTTGTRWSRWLYHGLHSMDLPWLYRNRPAWDITVLILMLGGTALCVTSVVIAWRRLRQKFRRSGATTSMRSLAAPAK